MDTVYNTGKGGIKVRARWRYDKPNNLIEIYEIPYSTTSEAIMDKVGELVKAGKLKEIADMRDETDLSGLKLTIDLKRGTDPDTLMKRLFRMTPLMDTMSCNFNVLVNGYPKVMGVREILNEWCKWRMDSVSRRTAFVLNKRKDKLHLLRGLEKILLDIDKTIKIIRETEREADVVPNLMIAFGIDEIQAEFVAEIKLRNINREYILKRTSEITALEKEIADLEDILEKPRRIKTIITHELEDVKKKYGAPRRTAICYDVETEAETTDIDAPADYPVTVFLTAEGYFKKITPQSLRMSGDHKLKEEDSIAVTAETTNNSEVMFFSDKQQVYKAHMYDFDDAKASVLGDYLPQKLGMDAGENIKAMVLPEDYKGHVLFFFENGKVAKIDVSAYQTVQNRKKLINAYSDKSPVRTIMFVKEDVEIAVFTKNGRALVFNTAQLSSKSTKSSQGVAVFSLKKKDSVDFAKRLEDTSITDPKRYRLRTLPNGGAIVREEDWPQVSMF